MKKWAMTVLVTIILLISFCAIPASSANSDVEDLESFPITGLFAEDQKMYISFPVNDEELFSDIQYDYLEGVLCVQSKYDNISVFVRAYSNNCIVDEIVYTLNISNGLEIQIDDEWVSLQTPDVQPYVFWFVPAFLGSSAFIAFIIGLFGLGDSASLEISKSDFLDDIFNFNNGNSSEDVTYEELTEDVTVVYTNGVPAMVHNGEEATVFQEFNNETVSKLDSGIYCLVMISDDGYLIGPPNIGKQNAILIMQMNLPYYHIWTAFYDDAEHVAHMTFPESRSSANCVELPFECDLDLIWFHHHGSWDMIISNSMAFFGFIYGVLWDDDPDKEWFEEAFG